MIARLPFVLASFCGLYAAQMVSAQTSKAPATRSGETQRARYQVDVRLRVAPEMDKARVIQWIEALRAAGVAGASEAAGPGAVPSPRDGSAELPIESAGAGHLLVHAVLDPTGTLHVGPETFRLSERPRLQAFIDKLRKEGAPGADPSAPLWGLGQPQWGLLQTALKQPSGIELAEKPLDVFLNELGGRIHLAFRFSPDAAKLAGAARSSTNTGRLTMGAALAYVLSQHELAFEPRQANGEISLLVLTRAESKRPWPIGLVPDQFSGTIAPRLMATARYKTDNTPLNELLSVFARELEMDVLLDSGGLALNHVDPATLRSTIQIQGGTIHAALRRTLAPMGLRHELRIDEANRPFLWITVGEPTGPVPKAPGKAKT